MLHLLKRYKRSMKKIILIFGCIFIYSNLFAKADFFRVMFYHNASHQATIGWTQMSGENPKLLLYHDGIVQNINSASIKSMTVIVPREPDVVNEFKGLKNYFVRLSGLAPNTTYRFMIHDSEETSKSYHFQTISNNPEDRLSLIGGGDSRTRRKERQQAFKMVAKLNPHAILFDGDYTDIDSGEKWRLWFEDWTLSYKHNGNKITPIIPARGNHERTNKDLIHFFDCPSKKNFYNVTMGGDLLNVICLNTEIAFGGAQKLFLKRTLESHKNYYWQLPQYHRSCRPHVSWKMKMRGVKQIYRHWIPLFELFGVMVALECDSHITKSTYPIVQDKGDGSEEGFKRDDENGIVYVGEGCWGAPLRTPDRIRSWSQDVDRVDSFKWFFIDQDKVEIRTVAYMNADSIPGLSDQNRFEIPENLNLWPNQDKFILINQKIDCPK